ncbi:MAG TPA: peptidase E [Candidatus Methanoperedens sp.]|nr:peptidase E [Candidatus Methanoperedens sp.]
MKKIVAIGGGEIITRDTEKIDRLIIELTEKEHPKVLFIPTASNDAEGYWKTFNEYFSSLGAIPSVLKLVDNPPSKIEIESEIFSSNAVYVGGGNTQKMLEIWKNNGVDRILKDAYEKGVVMSGLSAGAICWFKFGSSDSPSFNNPEDKQLILLPTLGFVDGLFSPHHIREPYRNEQLPRIIKESGQKSGFAVDDNAALIIIEGKAKVVTSVNTSGVKIFSVEDDKINKISIPKNQEFTYRDLVNNELNLSRSKPEYR